MNVDLASVREDIAYERRHIEIADRAHIEGRVANEDALQAAQRRRRERIAELELEEQALIALEEAASELRETFDLDFASAPHPMDKMPTADERREALKPLYKAAVDAFYGGSS